VPFGTVALPRRRRGVVICPEHHGPEVACARRRHRQHHPTRAQQAASAHAVVAAMERASDAGEANSAPPEPVEPVQEARRASAVVPVTAEMPRDSAVDPATRAGARIARVGDALANSATTITAGSITLSNIVNYTITWGTGGNGNHTGTGDVYTPYFGTPISTATTTGGGWATFMYDPYAGLGSGQVPRDIDEETAEERAERERRQAEREQRRRAEREYAERRAQANQRARALLEHILSPAQLDELNTRNTVTLVGSEGNRFRLECNHAEGNVQWLGDDPDYTAGQPPDYPVRGRMCAHPIRCPEPGQDPLPQLDVIIGQVLALRTDERAFVGHANPYGGEQPSYPPRPSAEGEAAA
jgi:hypothetical protein